MHLVLMYRDTVTLTRVLRKIKIERDGVQGPGVELHDFPSDRRSSPSSGALIGGSGDDKMEMIGGGSGDGVKHLEDCTVANAALGTWFFSLAGALLAIPVGIKRKSLAPLVFFGTTGTMLDIVMGINQCEREHVERQMKLQEEQKLAAEALATGAAAETES